MVAQDPGLLGWKGLSGFRKQCGEDSGMPQKKGPERQAGRGYGERLYKGKTWLILGGYVEFCCLEEVGSASAEKGLESRVCRELHEAGAGEKATRAQGDCPAGRNLTQQQGDSCWHDPLRMAQPSAWVSLYLCLGNGSWKPRLPPDRFHSGCKLVQ